MNWRNLKKNYVAYMRQIKDEAMDMVNLQSKDSGRKTERERSVCAAFLRCLGIGFDVAELRISTCDPPDILFRCAQFEVKVLYDSNREMHTEWKEIYLRRKKGVEHETCKIPDESC